MFAQGGPAACAAVEKLCKNIARGIYNLQCIFDSEKELIGGGISKQQILLGKIQEKLDEIYVKIPLEIPHAKLDLRSFYNHSNLIGALYRFLALYDKEIINVNQFER